MSSRIKMWNSRGLRRGARAVLAVLLIGAAVPAVAAGKITVTGEGVVQAAPDMATIMLGVSTQAKTAGAALADNTTRVNAIMVVLKSAGIAGRDMQTSGLSLNPQFDYGAEGNDPSPDITSYIVTNTVTVQVRALPDLGGVLDNVVQSGANTFNGLTFGLTDPAPVMDEARKQAVADARRKAELYAGAAGVVLGPVLSLTESGGYAQPAPMFRMDAAMSAGAVPVASGEIGVTASVTIEYELAE